MLGAKLLKNSSIATLGILSFTFFTGSTAMAADSLTRESDTISNTLSESYSPDQLLARRSVARLNFSWRTSPSDLAAATVDIIRNANVENVATLLLLLASGHDIYVARVRLSNTGNVPLRVYPQNIRLNYGSGSTYAIPVSNSRFLQPDILDPNYYIEKPVVFVAPYGLSLARQGRIGYRDNSIQVNYN